MQRKDREMIGNATDIWTRAKIRGGTLLREMAEKGERFKGGDPKSRDATLVKLSDLGVTKSESSRWQAFAALPLKQQEAKIEAAKKKAIATLDGVFKQHAGKCGRRMKRACERSPKSQENSRRSLSIPLGTTNGCPLLAAPSIAREIVAARAAVKGQTSA